MPIINFEVQKLSIFFQGQSKGLAAVDDLNFTLQPGKTLALLGESGCGKSLTSLALMRLLPEQARYAFRSVIKMGDDDLLELPEWRMRALRGRRIGMIFQEPMSALNPVLTIEKQLKEALAPLNLSRSQGRQQLINLLEEVELLHPEQLLNRYPHQLSGGQKQRVMIAMALAAAPELLIADEPTTALDASLQGQILSLLKKIQAQHSMSILLITHDLTVVKKMAHRVCVMYAGQIVEQSTAEDFFKEVRHPYVQQLLAALPDQNKRYHRLNAMPGHVPALNDRPKGCCFHTRCLHAFELCHQEIPRLQSIQGRNLRCHLYPKHHQLPSLSENLPSGWKQPLSETKLLLEVRQLRVTFSNPQQLLRRQAEVVAVDGLSFNLYQGKTLALVGESGSGKTTTSRALLGLHPINGGSIYYQGQEVGALKGRALTRYRHKVQMIFQDPRSSMNPRMTVAEILSEGMQSQGYDKNTILKKQKKLLEQIGLSFSSLNRYPHQFSGGQRQRICIARALATEPQVLICDEPTSALDGSIQAQVLNLLKELQEEEGLSYLLITHNMAVVAYLADEILVMKSGKTVEQGNPDKLLKQPQHPYTKQLIAAAAF